MASTDDRPEGLITGINVTPLVDVVLVLLIIFMATAPLMVKRALHVNVPKASTGERAAAALQVTLTADRAIYLEKTRFSNEELKGELERRRKFEPDLRIALTAEGALPYAEVVTTLDTIRSAGVQKVALEVRPAHGKK